jgi:hypothetical protein
VELVLADEGAQLGGLPPRLRASAGESEQMRIHGERRVENLRIFGVTRECQSALRLGDGSFDLAAGDQDLGPDLARHRLHVMRLFDAVQESLGAFACLVPGAAQVVEVRKLDAAPLHEAADSAPLGQVDDLLVELVRAGQIAVIGGRRRMVAERADRLGRADRIRDREGILEICQPTEIAGVRPRGADVVQRMGLQLAEPELSRQRQGLSADLDRLRIPACEHQEARRLGEGPRLRDRRRAGGDESAGALEPRERRVAPAREPVGLGEHRLGFRRGFEVTVCEHPLEGRA